MKMQKMIALLLSLVLCLGLLTGCGAAAAEEKVETPKFSELEYSRPDVEQLRTDVDAVLAALEAGKKLKEVTALLDVWYDDYWNFQTMATLADIYSCLDMSDEYYMEEYEWCSTAGSDVNDMFEEMLRACAASSLGEKLEKDYFWEGFVEEYTTEDEFFTDAVVELLQQESTLVAQYRELIARQNEELENYDFYDTKGYRATVKVYASHSEEFAQIYAELIRVRRALAEECGYESYEAYQYEYVFERDYSPEETIAYLADIKEYLVPLLEELYAYYGYVNSYELDEEELQEILQSVVTDMGGDIRDAFSFMLEHEMYNITPSEKKYPGSFATYLELYETPYLFVNPVGDTDDVLTFAHEFGHFTDFYVSYDPNESLDLAEVFSQSMENLTLSYLDSCMSAKKINSMTLLQLINTVNMYVQQASFADFENRVYALSEEELTAENISAISLEVAKEYGYYYSVFKDYYSYSWVDITHFFEYPYYVISYPVSCDTAMQILALEHGEEGAGLAAYNALLNTEESGIIAAVEGAGLDSPFAEGRIVAVRDLITEMVEEMYG